MSAVRDAMAQLGPMIERLRHQREMLARVDDVVFLAEALKFGCAVSIERADGREPVRLELVLDLTRPLPGAQSGSADTAPEGHVPPAPEPAPDAVPENPWLPGDDQALAVLRAQGRTRAEIAGILGRALDEIPEDAAPAPAPEKVPAGKAPPVWIGDDGLRRGPWSEEEERAAIEMRLRGSSLPAIASALRRALPATQQRFKRELRARWEAARDEQRHLEGKHGGADGGGEAPGGAVMATVPTAAADPAEAAPALPPSHEPSPVAKRPAPQPEPQAEPLPIDDHLAQLQGLSDAFWTRERDGELVRLAMLGWNAHDIAGAMGCEAAQVLARFEQLTDLRRFSRADVARVLGVAVPHDS
ncbi:MAG: hypothetical protein ACK4LQ_02195 [Pararhodobacter sp.]